jgi:hypothetical protein
VTTHIGTPKEWREINNDLDFDCGLVGLKRSKCGNSKARILGNSVETLNGCCLYRIS